MQLFKSPRAKIETMPTDDAPMSLAVLEFQSPTAAILARPMPNSARYSNFIITAMVFITLIGAAFIKVDKLVTSPGKLISSAPTLIIQPFGGGIIETINVEEGQIVRKGDVLATLNPTFAAADLTALTAQEQAYSAQVARLQAQENGTPYNPDPENPASALQMETYNQQQGQYNFTIEGYAQKINQLQTQISGFQEQARYYQQRLGIASNVEGMRKDLQQLQVGSKLDTLAATDDRVNIQSGLANAQSSAAAAERELAAQIAERDSFEQQSKATISQQLSDAINSLTQAEQALVKAKLNDQLITLKAPRDSVVLSVAKVSVGSVMQSGELLMQLVPIDAPFEVQADVNAADSGYVHPGEKVNIKFNTLPFLQYGQAEGTVLTVSPDSINPLDQASGGPTIPGSEQTSLFYRATISIDVINLHNTPPGFEIVPGMPLSADIKVGTRSVLGYFTRQFMPVAYESLHEP
ncbi:MAG: hemolysin D [Acidocella sp. 20-57-95]|nr:MAG: hemolysin D [Acidocella sp. 20-57-95]OYV58273.1 MAG: hemolysin D [Acidocella sp. 21-58-7]HQT63595.1 HlyD family type I secretion periplasmic adaptor subunit [Acidocella sp.]HQU05191.1 HlyD family type I secretion periplasmic adaptor subunit [Acidocella sp.]